MSYNNIEFAIGKGVAVLKLNRPDALNSFTAEMHGEVRRCSPRRPRTRRARVVAHGKRPGFAPART